MRQRAVTIVPNYLAEALSVPFRPDASLRGRRT